tara:strand:+ start:47 stop:232 length:186 start_codon:yes stop_codon:yes gene_type:complete
MINVFKRGGAWKAECGFEYTVKPINNRDKESYLSDGWFLSVEDANCIDAEPVKAKKVKAKK